MESLRTRRVVYGVTPGMDWEELRRTVVDFVDDAMPKLERADEEGINKGLFQRNSSNIVVTYPTKQDLDPLSPKAMFERKDGFKTLGRTLYVHIPFCTGICTYCAFARSAVSEDDQRIQQYLKALDVESGLMRSHLGFGGPTRVPVHSIYLGGGTPTLLCARDLERLLKMIARDFELRQGGEYTLEVSPETVTREKLTIARELGVNRISMGVESFDDHLLHSIKRRHDKRLVSETVAQFRECGFDHIDLDLIRNLPGSNRSTLKTDVDGVTELGVPSVTSYEYVVKPKSIDLKRYARGGLDVVARRDAVVTHLLFSMAMESLGYAQRPLGWFLKDTSYQYEQQLDKWERGYDLIPIGVSGYGYVHGVQFINHEGYEPYYKALNEGRLPIEKGAVLDAAEQAHRRAVFGLRTLVDRQELRETYGVDIFDDRGEARATVDKLIDMGLVEQVGSAYRLSQLGHLFQDQIQMEFYSQAYKDREASRMAALSSSRLPLA